MRILRAVAVAAMVAAGTAVGTPVAADVPLPDDVRVVEPATDVPASLRRFKGSWAGRWSGKLDTVVIVERVEPSGQADIVYAWGDYAPWSVTRDWERWTATIVGDTMTLERFPNGALVRFVFRSDGYLGGTYEMPRYIHHGTFRPGSE